MKNNEQYLGNRKLINQVLKLCFDINDNTKCAAWFWYSGHVGNLMIYVSSSKDAYTDKILNVVIDRFVDQKKELESVIGELVDILLDPKNK